jgi:hypothetical protein
MIEILFIPYNISIKSLNLKKYLIILHGLLYIGQGSFKIGSKEMIHYVKEAKKEAFKTVERFTTKKVYCLTKLFRALQTCEGLLPYCKLIISVFILHIFSIGPSVYFLGGK